MKHLYKLFFFCLLMPNLGLAQGNLVQNPSFEDYINCPVFTDSVLSIGWYSCGLSPDYYNSCANNIQPLLGVPSNWVGYQQPLDGNAYIGLITYQSNNQSPIREFVTTELLSPLIANTRYYVSAYISKSGLYPQTCSSNNFGFLFTNRLYNYINTASVTNYTHMYSDLVVSDSVGWTKVQGSFIADSSYQYLVLGNFYDDALTSVADCDTSDLVQAYYYIDRVCISTDSITCEVTTNINLHFAKPKISIFPNPAHDKISVNFPVLTGAFDISIFDMYGHQVLNKERVTSQEAQIDLSNLAKGLLLIRISHNNQFYFFKLLKQ